MASWGAGGSAGGWRSMINGAPEGPLWNGLDG